MSRTVAAMKSCDSVAGTVPEPSSTKEQAICRLNVVAPEMAYRNVTNIAAFRSDAGVQETLRPLPAAGTTSGAMENGSAVLPRNVEVGNPPRSPGTVITIESPGVNGMPLV